MCVEILSRGEKYGRIQKKVAEYLARGVRMVWAVDPESRTVTVHRAREALRVVQENEEIGGEDVLVSFRCQFAEFFRS